MCPLFLLHPTTSVGLLRTQSWVLSSRAYDQFLYFKMITIWKGLSIPQTAPLPCRPCMLNCPPPCIWIAQTVQIHPRLLPKPITPMFSPLIKTVVNNCLYVILASSISLKLIYNLPVSYLVYDQNIPSNYPFPYRLLNYCSRCPNRSSCIFLCPSII